MSPPLKPMLGDLELQQVQEIETDGEQVRTRHEVPALEGDFLQGLGRRGTRINVSGVLTGAESGEGLGGLRERFHAAEPVSFVSDIASATRVEDVVIEDLAVRELAGKPERFAYALTLRELTEAAPVEEEGAARLSEAPSPEVEEVVADEAGALSAERVERIAEGVGVLRVRVEVGIGDLSHVAVLVEGIAAEGERQTFLIQEQADGVYTQEGVPAGEYLIQAVRT